jgi:ABC-type lipoprotein export system ATPase subunit
MSENQNPGRHRNARRERRRDADASLTVVEDVNWSVAPGEFWVVAGQQHSGKSDLLMHAAGLDDAGAGSCKSCSAATPTLLARRNWPERLRVGFVFAGGQLFNQLTLAENVALPLRYQKNLTAAEAARRCAICWN